MQVDPIKSSLKAPGTMRLKPKYDEPLSIFAFNFNLRCYTLVAIHEYIHILQQAMLAGDVTSTAVRRCRLTLLPRLKPRLKPPGIKRLKLKCDAYCYQLLI